MSDIKTNKMVRLTAAAQAGKTIFAAPRERNSAQ